MERRARIRRSVALWVLALGCFAAGILLDGLVAPSPAVVFLPFAAFAGYLLLARLAVRASLPDADDIWRRSQPWGEKLFRVARSSDRNAGVRHAPSYDPRTISQAPRRPR